MYCEITSDDLFFTPQNAQKANRLIRQHFGDYADNVILEEVLLAEAPVKRGDDLDDAVVLNLNFSGEAGFLLKEHLSSYLDAIGGLLLRPAEVVVRDDAGDSVLDANTDRFTIGPDPEGIARCRCENACKRALEQLNEVGWGFASVESAKAELQAFSEGRPEARLAAQAHPVSPPIANSPQPRLVVILGNDGESPEIFGDQLVTVAVLRKGSDLEDYEPQDIFTIPSQHNPTAREEVVGHVERILQDDARRSAYFIDGAFDGLRMQHEREKAMETERQASGPRSGM